MTEDMSSRADFILEFMKLGMDFGNACIATECTPEMIKQLEEDPEFQQRKKFVLAKLEGELLKRLNKASEFAALKGDTRSTERLLEALWKESNNCSSYRWKRHTKGNANFFCFRQC